MTIPPEELNGITSYHLKFQQLKRPGTKLYYRTKHVAHRIWFALADRAWARTTKQRKGKVHLKPFSKRQRKLISYYSPALQY